MAEGTQAQRDALAYLTEILNTYNLGSLAPWAWEQIVAGKSVAEISIDIRQTPEFKFEYGGVIEGRLKAGLPAVSVEEILAYRKSARALMKSYGMPTGFYDTGQDFDALMVGDVSMRELEQRVVGAYVRVQQAPESVRTAFREMFNVVDDTALAAFILDDEKAMPVLERQVATASVLGYSRDAGIGFSRESAERLASYGFADERLRQGLTQLGTLAPLFDETLDEDEDLDVQDEGVSMAFGLTPGTEISRRRDERQARMGGGGTARPGGIGPSD